MPFVLATALTALLLEIAAIVAGWHGLTVLGRRWLLPLLALAAATGYGLLRAGIGPWPLVAAALGGILLFGLLASWRRRDLVPEALFQPGVRDGRRIMELALPLAGGPLPAVLVEPVAGSDVAVLMLHGAGDHKTHYAWPLLHGLADAGLAVCSIDVDGHGANPRVLDFPAVLENVAAGVGWLRERYRRVAVLGISQGGCLAARAVADGVDVDALALMEAPISIAVTRAVIRAEARILAHPAAWALHREVGVLGLARHWRTQPTRTRLGTVDLIKRLDLLGSVARISAPLLLVYGGSDAIVPVTQAHAVAAAAPAGTTLVLVPRATHLSLSIDRRVARVVPGWLAEQLGREPATGSVEATPVGERESRRVSAAACARCRGRYWTAACVRCRGRYRRAA